ncbi:amino acid adenylation domain-containing protein [Sphaerotilus montanus]|uniref:Phenolphthiocerol/phthiocerol polyketide synthase subunit E n=1 Tax=Sphaerotilus montanus TaxID=522889 RepID=A0A7Y9R5G5_9BURK|nr:non-ribosomal peptide synthetase/type I polyketide synthase [Sphaerotilus montanus]NYG35447.1 amino acid adenylation domain-containing protein [Sphaerotilus montanus]NZD57194.1 amino acid adenylation domain-containing protein [Sphaerotilus montanus]
MTDLNDMNDAAIAIIGLAGRFPGAPSLQDFWRHLCAGDEMITRFSDAELRAAGVGSALLDDPHYVRAGAVLPEHDRFDAAFFGFSPREAELLDPQQRLLLETAWEALDAAGYSDRTLPGRGSIGVFAGGGLNHYLLEHLHPNVALKSAVGAYQMFLVNSPDSVAMRLSYKLNLSGPSVTVQTACSTSLVAVHQACQSLLAGECDLALAGGVSLLLPQDQGYLHQEGMILSPDGHCRAFSEDAAGTLGGSGVGMVLLKPLAEALADGDVVHAVIRGSAVNNDGAAKISFTAPSVEGQVRVIREAQAVAEVEPDSIGYVEAHGTGTPLGDPIEVAALTEAFRSERRGVCALGSVKSNIGHADAAAGVAGLIKATLALQHGLIPPSLHAERPNPALKLAQSPFFIPSAPTPWPRSAAPRRAGVSAFGVGGTNAHVVLQEAPLSSPSDPGRPQQLLLLSARSEDGLVAYARALAARLAEAPDLVLADVACSLAYGRQHHPVRGVLLCRDTAEAAAALAAAADDGSVCGGEAPEAPRPVVFMFPGQGTQTVNMGRELYDTEPVFRAQVDHCAELLQPLTGYDLRERLYAAPGDRQAAEDRLHQPSVTQPALFVTSYALAQLWLSWGVKPQAMIGHSFGEYVAATVAGVLSLPEALGLVALRGRLMEAQPEGAMLAVSLAAEQLALPPGVALAAVNGPAMSVVSGTPQDIAAFQQHLTVQGVMHRLLHVNRAFHSVMMEPVLAPLVAHLRTLTLRAPRIPYLSNLTGTWITDAQATDPDYWARHTREPVQFASGVAALAKEPALILLEVGPGRALGALARQQPGITEQVVLRSTPQPQEARSERECLLDALGQLWTAGGLVDWAGFFDLDRARRQRVTLPTCPFERQRYWIDRPAAGADLPRAAVRRPLADWFHVPGWERVPLPQAESSVLADRSCVLVFADALGLGDRLALRLVAAGHTVIIVRPGSTFAWSGDTGYAVDPRRSQDFTALVDDLLARQLAPQQVVHLWQVTPLSAPDGQALVQGFYSLMFLARALSAIHTPVQLTVVANHVQAVTGDEALDPEKAALLGLVRVIPQEYPHIACRCLDLDGEVGPATAAVDQVLAELAQRRGTVVAYRGRYRWTPTFQSVRLQSPAAPDTPGPFREGGVYLITGGLGEIGLVLAEHLATWRTRLVLIGRSPVPPRQNWRTWLTTHAEDDATSRRLRRLLAIEQAGAQVLALSADVADEAQLGAALRTAQATFGPLNGVFHAAGITREPTTGAFIQTAQVAECDPHFRAKLGGAQVLDRLLHGQPLDFCIAFSSLAAVLGGLGFGAYSAANAALDCFVTARRQNGVLPWTSLNWEGWRQGDTPLPRAAGPGDSVLGLALQPEEGLAALRAVLASRGHEQILLSTGDLQARLDQWQHRPADLAPPTPPASGNGLAQSKRRTGRMGSHVHVAARDSVEQGLIGIWQELLGVTDIGVNDDFWALGGHSLLATQVIAHVRKVFQVALSMKTVFEEPTVAGLAITVARLQRLASGVTDRQDPGMTLVPRATTAPVPLSFAQQRLWFLTQFEANPSLYNLPAAIHLHGALQVSALEQAFQTVEARHASLRTSFPEQEGQPCQRVHPPSFRLAVTDLSTWPDDRQQAEVTRQVRQQNDQAFDLANGPLWNATLLRLSPKHHVLTLTLHHAIADGWSMGILMHELSTLYGTLVAGRPASAASLPALPVQYADYALWQREWLRGPVLEAQLDYWRQRLDGAPPLLTLPTDHPRPAVQRGVGDKFVFLLPSGLTEALKHLGRAENATLFMVVQAVFSVLLARYAGQDDIVIGTPSANRQFAETEPLIGLFLNALVLRTDVSGNPSFRELLARVRQGDLDAFQRHALPFETLVEALRPERSLAYTPVFQVMFNLLTNRSHALTLEGLRAEHAAIDDGMAKHDLTLMMHEIDTGLHTVFEYDTDLFERATIERMAGHFRVLLETVIADPGQPIGQLPLLTDAEHAQMLLHWNDNATADAGDAVYARLFEAQVAASPDQDAVRWQPEPGGPVECLSYAELNHRANQLAHVLKARGLGGPVGSEDIVGVCLERSAETLVCLLALFKVGAAYMPLDPSLPDERLVVLMARAGTPLVLTLAHHADRLTGRGPALMCLDRDADLLARQPTHDPDGPGDAARLAYVLFTSGSTGVPKGVMVEHRGMVNNLRAKLRDHGLGAGDTLAQTAPPGFDISVWQFLAALLVGGTVRIFGDEIAKDPAALLRHVEAERVTVLEVVPSLLRFMLDELQADEAAAPALAALRWLSLTGEALPPALCNAWFARYPRIPILNAYGPAECSDDATHHILTGPLPPDATTVPIGRALPNVRLYVLDAHRQPLPIGVPGELCIGGIGVGRGYLNDPERTAAAFHPDPWAGQPGARLYRTGDMARWRADGTLEFLGRLDFQVKLRGLRIELGEIEAALDRHPAVEQSVVIVHTDARGEQQLVAHVAMQHSDGDADGDAASAEALAAGLAAHLGQLLPSYMVPSRFLVHEALPLTPNGKIDRKRLPAPDNVPMPTQDSHLPPVTPTETLLACVWQEVLRLERVGRHDHFFALGGHSLLATQVVSRLRRQLGIELPLRTVFAAPTLAGLAEQIDQRLLLQRVQQVPDDLPSDEREEILI